IRPSGLRASFDPQAFIFLLIRIPRLAPRSEGFAVTASYVRTESMLLNVCIAKIHRATVTDADLNYVGSITIDEALLEAAGLHPGQMVQITNVSNAVLWRTYIVLGERLKGQIVLNGPPARLFQRGDKVII